MKERSEASTQTILTDWATACLLRFWGVPFPKARLARTAVEAVGYAEELGYPVVLKTISPDIPHKTEAGAIRLGVRSPEEVVQAYEQVLSSARKYQPQATIHGVMVQPMQPPSAELIVGGLRDPSFGPVISVGMGGIYAEVYRDIVWRLAPVTLDEAMEMLTQLEGYPILTGARGKPPVNLQAAAEVVVKASQAVAEITKLREMDINPLLVYPDKATAVDGLMRLEA